ncbi:uncharacterized protein WCC33_006899 [Rhinophrynus dorsalis]
MSAMDTLPPPIPLSQKPTRIIKARPPNRPPPHLPPKPPQLPPCPQNAPVPTIPRRGSGPPEVSGDGQPLAGVSVKKIAGLFQRDPVGGAGGDPQPKEPPRAVAAQGKEERAQSQRTEDLVKVQTEKEEDRRPCPPPLPPKLFQEPEEGTVKMGTCPPHKACPTRCRCACHEQRPGMVLVWVPESFVPKAHDINGASDSSDDGGVLQRAMSVTDDDDGGKWGQWRLRNKMVAGASYPVRRRSQRFVDCAQDGVTNGEEKARNSVVLTSYKSTSECSFNGEMTGSTAEEGDIHPLSNTRCSLDSNLKESPQFRRFRPSGNVDSTSEIPSSEQLSTNGLESEQSEAPLIRSSKFKSTPSSVDAEQVVLPMEDSQVSKNIDYNPQKNASPSDPLFTTPEVPKAEVPPLREPIEDKYAESLNRVRKPARRNKMPSHSLSGIGDLPPAVPPKVPSKPPRGAAPPPPPFLRQGSLKRYSAGNADETKQKEKKGSSSSLPTDKVYRTSENRASSEDSNGGVDDLYESSGGSSVFRSPPLKSPKSIDWESHLADEPLYQTYRQAVIRKEIRRQTVPRNSSFTSYDSSHDSPLSSGGSPKQGRRSTTPHNTLWQELPVVRDSRVLEDMSNEEKKMQESMFEVLTSEASYLRSINVLIEHFMESRDLEETLIIREKKILFSNILKVKEVSESAGRAPLVPGQAVRPFFRCRPCAPCSDAGRAPLAPVQAVHPVFQGRPCTTCSRAGRAPLVPGQAVRHLFQCRPCATCSRAGRAPLVPGQAVRHLFQGRPCTTCSRAGRAPLVPGQAVHHLFQGRPCTPCSRAGRAPLVPGQAVHPSFRCRPCTTCSGAGRAPLVPVQAVHHLFRCRPCATCSGAGRAPLVPGQAVRHLFQGRPCATCSRAGRAPLVPGQAVHHLFQGRPCTTCSRAGRAPLVPGQAVHPLFQGRPCTTCSRAGRAPLVPGQAVHHLFHSERYVVLDYAHRSLVQIQSCPTAENSFFLTLLENHQGKTCDRLFKAPTQSDMHRWVAAFPNKNDDALSGSDTIYEDWDCPQVQCVEPYSAVQTDELSLEPADIINVLRKTSEGWYEGIRLSDGKKGWFPALYVQEITNEHVRRRNLRERHRVLQAARQIQLNRPGEPRKKASSA